MLIVNFDLGASAQPGETFITSFDPNPQNMFQADKGTNIWSIGNYIYLTNGYVNAQGGGSQQIFKINASTREIVKQIVLEGPKGDIRFAERGGYWITSDNYILITGQWHDYAMGVTRAMLTKFNVLKLQRYDLFAVHILVCGIPKLVNIPH